MHKYFHLKLHKILSRHFIQHIPLCIRPFWQWLKTNTKVNYRCHELHSNGTQTFDSKMYYAVIKTRNDRKHPEINTIHKEVIKAPFFKDITKDRLRDGVCKLAQNWILLNKPNIDKGSLGIIREKINYPSINISSFPTHSPLAALPKISRLSTHT